MDCTDFNGLLDNYLNLSDAEKSEMDTHVLNCMNCKSELEFYKSIMDTMSTLPAPQVPLDFIDRVNERIDNLPVYTKVFDSAYNGFRKHKEVFAAAAACAAVGVTVGLNSNLITDNIDESQYIPTTTAVSSEEHAESEPESTEETVPQEQKNQDVSREVAATESPARTAAPAKQGSPAVVTAAPKPKPTPAQKRNAPVTVTNRPAETTAEPKAQPLPDEVTGSENNEIQEQQENNNSSRYTLPRASYHVPDVASANIDVQSNEPAAYSTDFVSEYELAMSDTPIDEKVATRNKLIVSNDVIQDVLNCMSECGVTSTNNGYWASLSVLNGLLQKLDEQGIEYTYAQTGSDETGVQFMLFGI